MIGLTSRHFNGFNVMVLILGLFTPPVISQNTVGLTSVVQDEVSDGYVLLYPHAQPNVFLIDPCGQIVHIWEDEEGNAPGNSVYLLENGDILKTKNPLNAPDYSPVAGGAGGVVELRNWQNELLWQTAIMDSTRRAHHDISPMPNGNVLIVYWERKFLNEILAAGLDTSVIKEQELWPDAIMEVNIKKDSIVWEWHAWDHLVQQFDSTKLNYGIVKDHPELIHINYDLNGMDTRGDWMHVNAIDYNEDLDQILLSVPFFDEIWIIDHSTTIEEAKGHSGGNSGKGGDLLFRWGNPIVYQAGDKGDQKLFFQHDAHWIGDFLNKSDSNYGKIALFNNRAGSNYSKVGILNPVYNEMEGIYEMEESRYLPDMFDFDITHPDTFRMFSGGLSSVQVLPNNNLLICVGRSGYIFEMTFDQKLLWEYILPLKYGSPVSQGTLLNQGDNVIFRAKKYPLNYDAFLNRDLSPLRYIESNPNLDYCDLLSTSIFDIDMGEDMLLYPLPAGDFLNFKSETIEIQKIEFFDILGNKHFEYEGPSISRVNIAHIPPQIYFVRINDRITKKIMKL